MPDMNIRKAAFADAPDFIRLHTRSVLELCRNDYSSEQLQYWVSHSTLEKYQLRLKRHPSYIAERDGKMIGYVCWNPETNELCSIFVDPEYVRQGVATALMEVAYQDAISKGVKDLWLFASLTAVPFYQAIGWHCEERKMRGELECVKMSKHLA